MQYEYKLVPEVIFFYIKKRFAQGFFISLVAEITTLLVSYNELLIAYYFIIF